MRFETMAKLRMLTRSRSRHTLVTARSRRKRGESRHCRRQDTGWGGLGQFCVVEEMLQVAGFNMATANRKPGKL